MALFIVGVVILEGASDRPEEDPQPAAWAQYYADEEGKVLAGGFVFMLGAAFLLWFVAQLRAWLGAGSAATTAFAGGIALAVCALLIPSSEMAAALEFDDGGISGEAAEALATMPTGFFIGAEVAGAVLLAAVGVLAIRTRVLPGWLGWISLVIALVLLIPPIGWAALLFALPLWVVVVSVLMSLRTRTADVSTADVA